MPLLQKAYLGSTALFRDSAWFEDDSLTLLDTSSATTITASSTAHTKGAWSQLIASTSANASLLWIEVAGIGATTTNTATLLDIGFGASGSESVKIENVAVGGAATAAFNTRYVLLVPFQIPSGTRIAARIQSVVTGGKTASVTCRTYDAGDYSSAPTSVDTIGTSTATSAGTAFVTSNSYVQLTSSTSRKYRGIVIVPSIGASTGQGTPTYTLARGASGSEVALGSMNVATGSSETLVMVAGDTSLIGGEIAAGTRLAVKAEVTSNITNHLVCLIGIP